MVERNRDYTLREVIALLVELDRQTDRGAAIIAAQMVENEIARLLESAMIQLSNNQWQLVFGDRAPLGTFSAKIELARALDLVGPDTYSDLTLIRRIRNRFAHSVHPLKFSDQQLNAWCNNLKLPDRVRPSSSRATKRRLTARGRFIAAAKVIFESLLEMHVAEGPPNSAKSDLFP